MKYTLRQLAYFVAASDNGSISAAARAMNVSQPSISNAIIQLEKQFDVALFLRRHSNGVRLTPTGEILLREARRVLAHADDFETLASSILNEVSGEIQVACFVNVAPVYMAALTRSFQDRYPLARVIMTIGNQQEVFDAINSGSCELALTFDLELPKDYHSEVCVSLPPKLVIPMNHRFSGATKVDLGDMLTEPFIYLDLPYSKNYFFSLFENVGLLPDKTIPVGSFETIRTFVGNSLGYSLLNLVPESEYNYDGTRVEHVELEGSHRPLNLCCISLKRMVYRRTTMAFVEHAKEFFSRFQV